jgi:hypothetical protein
VTGGKWGLAHLGKVDRKNARDGVENDINGRTELHTDKAGAKEDTVAISSATGEKRSLR